MCSLAMIARADKAECDKADCVGGGGKQVVKAAPPVSRT